MWRPVGGTWSDMVAADAPHMHLEQIWAEKHMYRDGHWQAFALLPVVWRTLSVLSGRVLAEKRWEDLWFRVRYVRFPSDAAHSGSR